MFGRGKIVDDERRDTTRLSVDGNARAGRIGLDGQPSGSGAAPTEIDSCAPATTLSCTVRSTPAARIAILCEPAATRIVSGVFPRGSSSIRTTALSGCVCTVSAAEPIVAALAGTNQVRTARNAATALRTPIDAMRAEVREGMACNGRHPLFPHPQRRINRCSTYRWDSSSSA